MYFFHLTNISVIFNVPPYLPDSYYSTLSPNLIHHVSNYIQPLILPPIFLAVGFPFFKVTNELNEPAADMQSRQQTAKWGERNSERTFFTVSFLRDISSILALEFHN